MPRTKPTTPRGRKAKTPMNELERRLREKGYTPGKARTHMKPENGVFRTLTAIGLDVNRKELEAAYQKMINDARTHDKEVVRRARARWNV